MAKLNSRLFKGGFFLGDAGWGRLVGSFGLPAIPTDSECFKIFKEKVWGVGCKAARLKAE